MKSKVKLDKDLYKELSKALKGYTFIAGIGKGKNTRRKVSHKKGSTISTTRGLANKKIMKRAHETNTDIIDWLYNSHNFHFYSLSFTNQNPNLNTFLKSVKYLVDNNPRKFENAVTANIKAFLDLQRRNFNTAATIKTKKFDRFGIDSRQMQLALDCERVKS